MFVYQNFSSNFKRNSSQTFFFDYLLTSDGPQKDRMLSVVESSVDVTRRVMNTPSTNTWKRVNRKWNKRLSKKNKYGKYIWVLLPWVNHSPPKHNRWLHIHHHVGGFKHIVNVVISTMRNNKKFTIRTTNSLLFFIFNWVSMWN